MCAAITGSTYQPGDPLLADRPAGIPKEKENHPKSAACETCALSLTMGLGTALFLYSIHNDKNVVGYIGMAILAFSAGRATKPFFEMMSLIITSVDDFDEFKQFA